MKINIPKMQDGGTIGSSAQAYGFLDYMPVMSQPTQQGGASPTRGEPKQTATESNNIISDDMIKALMGKGLTSDVNKFISEVNSLYSDPFGSNPFGTSVNSSDLARKQLALVGKINQIQNGKELFGKAVDSARTSGALDEIAVTSFGKVVSMDNETGGVKQISPDELAKNRDRFIPLTNAELASMRMNNTSLAFDTNVFNILENAVGSKQVDEYIRTIINETGKTTSENNSFYSAKDLQTVKGGLELLQEGTYKVDTTTEDNMRQIEAATQYLYKSLPDNYRKFLTAKAASEGRDPHEGVFSLIQDYANAKLTTASKTNISRPTELNKTVDEGKNSVSTDIIELMAQGQSEKKVNYVINEGSPYTIISQNSPYYNNIPTLKGDNLKPIVTLNTLLTDTKLSSLVDKAGVSVGNQVAKPTDFSNIGVDTSQGYVMAMLPVKTVDGRKVVDLDVAKKFQQVNIPVGATNAELRNIYAKEGLSQYLDVGSNSTEKLFKEGKVAPFLVASGYASDNNFIKDNKAVQIIDDRKTAKLVEESINKDREDHNLGEVDFSQGAFNANILGGIGNVNMYRTSIFLPYSETSVSETLLSNNHVFAPKKNRNLENVLNIQEPINQIGRTNF